MVVKGLPTPALKPPPTGGCENEGPAGPRVGGQPGGPHFGRAADEDDGAQKAQKAKTGAGKAALARREVTPREAPGEGIRKTDKPARQGLLEPCPVCLEAAARPALMLALSSASKRDRLPPLSWPAYRLPMFSPRVKDGP